MQKVSPFRLCSPSPEASPRARTPSGVSQPETSSSSFSRPLGGRVRAPGGSQGAPGVVSREASSPPAWPRSSERECVCVWGGKVSGHSSVVCERASVSSAPSGAGEGEVARSHGIPLARSASSVASPCSSQHARRCEELREVSEDHSHVRSSRGSRSSD